MIEDNKIVRSITAKSGGKSGTYWTVNWYDGKTDNIFNRDWLPLLEQSQRENRLLHFTKEKKGNYYNIVTLKLATLPEKPKEAIIKSVEVQPVQSFQPTPLTKDAQIERAVWIKELGECIRFGDIDTTTPEGKALRSAYYTEMLRVLGINVQEVLSASYLTEEAKRLGAKEIKEREQSE